MSVTYICTSNTLSGNVLLSVSEPSAVRELNLVVTASHLTVTWDPPLMPNGIVSYDVLLSGVNLANDMLIDISDSSVNVTQTMYSTPHSPLPYSNYTAVVTAFTSVGFGPEEVDSELTQAEGE